LKAELLRKRSNPQMKRFVLNFALLKHLILVFIFKAEFLRKRSNPQKKRFVLNFTLLKQFIISFLFFKRILFRHTELSDLINTL
jgi:hypothetical protein